MRKNTSASARLNPAPRWAVSDTASSTASSPKSVVNLMIGLSATDDVSLNGSPTVSPTTVAACSSVPFCLSSTSTIFFALSHAPPALAMNTAWYRPKSAIEIEIADEEVRLDEREGERREEDADEDVEHPLLRVLRADLDDGLAVHYGGLRRSLELDVRLDVLHRSIRTRRHRLNRCAGEPVNHGAAGDEPEQERRVQQRQIADELGLEAVR